MFARWWLALVVAGAAAQAAENDDAQWDVNAPPGERREIRIDTRSGTWLSIDVSPDGERVLFDLLGDIYEVPIGGGMARALTSGLAWDMQPRYSPDAQHIAFTSDRAGGDNIWIMRADGTQLRQITKEEFRLLNNPAWHPSGKYIAARKHFTTRRSLGTGEIWLYSIDGGDGVQLVKRPSEEFQKELGEPAFAPDGEYLYFAQNSTPGDTFIYAQDSNSEVFQVRRYDLASGKIDAVVTGPGGAVRPTPSPDGRYLAFLRRLRTPSSVETALYLKDLTSGAERPLYTGLDRDMQETWAVNGVYPNIDWTPDSKSLVVWAGGAIRRIDVDSGAATDIPFHVNDTRSAIAPPRFKVSVAPEEVTAKMVRFASVAPDGERAVYEAFGKLWLKPLPDGTARRLTRDDSNAFELFASWSRDGKHVTFVRWTDAGLGEIHVVDGRGGRSRAITRHAGHYFDPRFSPDGATIVFEKGTGGQLTSPLWSADPGIYRVPSAGGEAVRLTDQGRTPHFGANGGRVFYVYDREPAKEGQPAHELVSVDINGKDRRVHAKSHYATRMLVSPSGEWLTFRENYHVFATAMPPAGELELSPKTKALPLRRLSEFGGEYPSWSDGDTLTWVLGPTLYRAEMGNAFEPASVGAKDAPPKYGAALANLSITRPAAKPTGTLALTGARLITMNARDEVIENGTIVVRDNRIVAIGPANAVQIPGDARRLDLEGRTIMPGIIDIHAHGSHATNDIVPQQNWDALAHLALGVTTVHDPANQATEIFTAAEYQRAGLILSPRIFSTGDTIYGARSESFASIDTLEDARAHVQRLKAQGAISVKNYNQPRREQRQMIVAAAREAGLMSVAEGGSLYPMDITIIADGNTGLEHNMPPEKFYDDVLQFWPATGVGYTPTLVVTFGGLGIEHHFYQANEVWKHPILSRYVPPHVLQPRSVRRQMAPDTDYQPARDSATNGKALMERGVLVNIGAHGQREGLGSHWEMWGFVMGGMSHLQALKAATINPARYMGFDADLGSLEPNKLADLLILEGNPLEDIRATDDIAYVVLNGRVYEGGSLEEKITGDFKLQPFYWQQTQ
jgi:imidazolonepropionase-like amidohydrolase/Tol biopolymer transport system component